MNKTTITIYTDDDGFYGNSSSEMIARFSHEASYTDFQIEVNDAIFAEFGNVEIEHRYESNYDDVKVSGSDDEYAADTVREIVGRIYNDGKFWVMK